MFAISLYPLKYILIYGSVLEKQEKMKTKLQSSLLHEFIHGIDSASAPNLFKNSRYLRKNELVEQLGDADLSKILNTIYLEEHAYGQTIRSLNKKKGLVNFREDFSSIPLTE